MNLETLKKAVDLSNRIGALKQYLKDVEGTPGKEIKISIRMEEKYHMDMVDTKRWNYECVEPDIIFEVNRQIRITLDKLQQQFNDL